MNEREERIQTILEGTNPIPEDVIRNVYMPFEDNLFDQEDYPLLINIITKIDKKYITREMVENTKNDIDEFLIQVYREYSPYRNLIPDLNRENITEEKINGDPFLIDSILENVAVNFPQFFGYESASSKLDVELINIARQVYENTHKKTMKKDDYNYIINLILSNDIYGYMLLLSFVTDLKMDFISPEMITNNVKTYLYTYLRDKKKDKIYRYISGELFDYYATIQNNSNFFFKILRRLDEYNDLGY